MPDHIADANKKVQPILAPLPEEAENLIWTFRCDLRRAIPGDVSEMLLTLVNADDLHKAINLITDLTRRLAEAERTLVDANRSAAYNNEKADEWCAKCGDAEARVRELEAFKARVMAWARGSCGICAHAPCHQTSQGCKNCTRFRGGIPGEKADNWTPPQAWEVGSNGTVRRRI